MKNFFIFDSYFLYSEIEITEYFADGIWSLVKGSDLFRSPFSICKLLTFPIQVLPRLTQNLKSSKVPKKATVLRIYPPMLPPIFVSLKIFIHVFPSQKISILNLLAAFKSTQPVFVLLIRQKTSKLFLKKHTMNHNLILIFPLYSKSTHQLH